MLRPEYTGQFKRDVQRADRRGKNMDKLRAVIRLLLVNAGLPHQLGSHFLKGTWKGFRELHIEPDWLLIYKSDDKSVRFVRTGTHADLFGK